MTWDSIEFEKTPDAVQDSKFSNWATHSAYIGKPKKSDPHFLEDKHKLRLSIEKDVSEFIASGGVIEQLPRKTDEEIRGMIKTQWLDKR